MSEQTSDKKKDTVKERYCFGRKVLYAPYTQKDLNKEVIKEILNKVFPIHLYNKNDISYLEDVYKGRQAILFKTKDIRPNINNIVVENFAYFMTEFKKAYIFGKPIKYVQMGEIVSDEISILNRYMTNVRKHTKDTLLAESLFNCGIAHLIVLPNKNKEKEIPFDIEVLDSKKTFVVYESAIGNKPLLGCTYYVTKVNGDWVYKGSIYTRTEYYEFKFKGMNVENIGNPIPHLLGSIPIVEYYLNKSRLGIVEVTLSMQNVLNKIDSSDMDGIEQFIQSLLVFVNNDVDAETFEQLMQMGALKIKSENNFPADVKMLVNNLDHSNTDVYYQRTLSNMLNIVGIPIPSTKTSGGDTGEARQLGDGWTMADLRADQDELMFKNGEISMLELVLKICKTDPNCEINTLKVEDIDTKFERNKSDNMLVKTQSLVNLMNAQVSPKSAMSVVGLWSDANAVCEESKEFYGENWWKQEDIVNSLNADNTNVNNSQNYGEDKNDSRG